MVRLTIDRLSHDGRGIARRAGKIVFVGGALPGEEVEADIARRHRRFDEYRLIEVVHPAPDRVAPGCPLVGRCGGCDLQHLAPTAQIEHKTSVLLDQLARQAGLVPRELLPPLTDGPFGYRRRARLSVHVPRRGGRPVLGFRAAGGTEIVPIDRCPVLVPALERLPGRLQTALLVLESPTVLGHVLLSLTETEAQPAVPVIHLRVTAPLGAADRKILGDFATAAGAFLLVQQDGVPLEYLHRPDDGTPAYRIPEFGLEIAYPPGGFVQGNAAVNRQLVSRVVDWAVGAGSGRVLDAFCGVGNFALPLARQVEEVIGIEVSADAVAAARDNAQTNGIANVAFRVADLMEDGFSLDPIAIDTAVLDPPRQGARALTAELVRRGVARIVYVSCAPATLARDAACLAQAGYQLDKLCLVDMFPETSHIESLALFSAGGRKGGSKKRS